MDLILEEENNRSELGEIDSWLTCMKSNVPVPPLDFIGLLRMRFSATIFSSNP